MSEYEYSDYSTGDTEFYNLDEQLKLFRIRIDELWDNVIVPYISNKSTCQVLNKLENIKHDKDLFYNFMLKNNSSYSKLFKYQEYLNNN